MSNEGETTQPTGTGALEALLAQAGLSVFADDVRRDVDTVLASGQALEPAVRKRFVDAAGRGTRQWALRRKAALETLLFEARRTRGEDAETVAERAGIAAEAIRSIERGELPIDAPQAAAVASWAFAMNLDRSLLSDALRRSLATRTSSPAYAGEPDARLQPDQERFVDEVLGAFDDQFRGGGG